MQALEERCDFLLAPNKNPYRPCMVYLPTFTLKINQM